jgi:hypothetical protein
VATPAGVATTPAPSNVTVTGSPATSATVAKAAAATPLVSAVGCSSPAAPIALRC